jgi:AcrR family transcriptional regulator
VSERPRRGRPTRAEASAIEQRIREEALAAFLERGFDGTTMQAVAAAAGVTKRTLYAKYPDKEALFGAVVPWALAGLPFAGLRAPEGDLATVLRSLGHQVIDRLVDPHAVKVRRLAVREATRIAALDHAAGLDLWRDNVGALADLLAPHAEAGEIAVDDLVTAADLFLALVAGAATVRADVGMRATPEDEARHVAAAVDLFLSGTLPRPTPPPP